MNYPLEFSVFVRLRYFSTHFVQGFSELKAQIKIESKHVYRDFKNQFKSTML